ncbi:phospholipid carrier-dependent glycosyltransferase [Asticcacaulis sp. 201]|uniref:phospholipid carrier-dependent glycosyltransferase n=1 Tax=Asticcacaulis sp. 201 TaxID=3028787 RepID=UPI002916487C|nr:phospholipid carrier-dependent glycosyltransferase [Asticcacaulis sp. 201]MDV6330267.1 phospholipid carrier-dependent glycosyltransferase [Asticcacaulis sp. 201]
MTADPNMPAASFSQKTKAFANALWNADEKTLRWVLGVLIVILAGLNFVRDLDNPHHAFWDESYYLTSTQRYVEDKAQYASHPPLGFMFMDAGVKVGKLFGINKDIDTHFLGDTKKIDSRVVPKGYDFTPIRMPSALFSVVAALLFYLIVLRLSGEAFEAFVFALLFVFENAYIVHFRAAHLDAYQFTFTLGSILVWLFTFGREPKRPLVTYALFGLLCGLSFMVKVNSLVMLALGALSLIRAVWVDRSLANWIRQFWRGTAVIGAFVATVAAIFTLHFAINPNLPDSTTRAGQRDLRATSQPYKDYLMGKRALTPVVLWAATNDYYRYMKYDFTGEVKTEPNGSQPALWPFMAKAINYRWDFDGKKTAYVQMVGNPVNWGLGIVGIAGALVLILRRRFDKTETEVSQDYDRLEALFAMFMIFWTFHIYLGLHRVMYIYHYFIGLALSFLLISLVFKIVSRRVPLIEKHRFSILCTLSVIIACSYLFYAPLTYHQFLTRSECELRNIPVTLVICQPAKKKIKAPPVHTGVASL